MEIVHKAALYAVITFVIAGVAISLAGLNKTTAISDQHTIDSTKADAAESSIDQSADNNNAIAQSQPAGAQESQI